MNFQNFKSKIHVFIERYRYSLFVYFIVLTAFTVNQYLFCETICPGSSSLISSLLKNSLEGIFFLIPFFFLKPKYQWLAISMVWVQTIYIYISLPYFRFWNDIPSYVDLSSLRNVNSDLFGMASTLYQGHDILYLLILLLSTGIVYMLHKRCYAVFPKRLKLLFTAISIISLILSQFGYFRGKRQWDVEMQNCSFLQAVDKYYNPQISRERQTLGQSGLFIYILKNIQGYLKHNFGDSQLTLEKKNAINQFIFNISRLNEKNSGSNNQKQKIICIIVESLNHNIIGKKINNKSITPVLDSLINNQHSLFIPRVVSQIKYGNSADGHLLIYTGLLPLKDSEYALQYGHVNEFPSITKILDGYYKTIMLGDDGHFWNESSNFYNFGFDKVIEIDDFKSSYPTLNADAALFTHAAEYLQNAKPPYILGLVTYSMHVPFTDSKGSPLESAKLNYMSDHEKNYIKAVAAFDKSLGLFLKSVPEDALVIITSDHTQRVASFGEDPLYCSFLALNAMPDKTQINRIVGQSNLYPLILDLIGLKGYHGFRGLSLSALNPRVTGAIDAFGVVYGSLTPGMKDSIQMAYEYSDMIIKGDYFRNNSLAPLHK